MRYCLLSLFLFVSVPALAQNVPMSQVQEPQTVLIKDIRIEGFVLGDREQFIRLFKPYRNKHLTTADMDAILDEVKQIYEQEGYQELTSIEYHVNRSRLTFTVSLIK